MISLWQYSEVVFDTREKARQYKKLLQTKTPASLQKYTKITPPHRINEGWEVIQSIDYTQE